MNNIEMDLGMEDCEEGRLLKIAHHYFQWQSLILTLLKFGLCYQKVEYISDFTEHVKGIW